jgi:hypothetical protein
MTSKWLVVLGLSLAACAGDGGGDGNDALPKRGERTGDPTIVSATASCGLGGSGSTPTFFVKIDATDPMGKMNLGTCSATYAGTTDQGSFGEFGCNLQVAHVCQAGDTAVVDMVVSNDTGGVTTASVRLPVVAAD